MRIIRAPHLARAHELAIKMVLEKGRVIETEDGEATIEFEEIAMKVDRPLTEPMVSASSRFQRRFMEQYADDLIHGSAGIFEYDYHTRLFNWGERLSAGEGPVHIDQIAYIKKKLREAPVSRRAIAITWNPLIDEQLEDCPCLQLVQALVRDGCLQLKVVFRSNDILTAAGANMFALASLQKTVADDLGVNCGSYTHISLVPHIYFKRDINDIEPFCMRGAAIQPVPEICRACGRCSTEPTGA